VTHTAWIEAGRGWVRSLESQAEATPSLFALDTNSGQEKQQMIRRTLVEIDEVRARIAAFVRPKEE
jgi:hypothetical protein